MPNKKSVPNGTLFYYSIQPLRVLYLYVNANINGNKNQAINAHAFANKKYTVVPNVSLNDTGAKKSVVEIKRPTIVIL